MLQYRSMQIQQQELCMSNHVQFMLFKFVQVLSQLCICFFVCNFCNSNVLLAERIRTTIVDMDTINQMVTVTNIPAKSIQINIQLVYLLAMTNLNMIRFVDR